MKRRLWRRYALTLTLLVVSIATLGVYYGYAADERLPAFRLETVQGDPTLGESLVLSGNYGGRMRSKYLEVTTDGSEYRVDTSWGSLFDRRYGDVQDPIWDRLLEEYPGFRRGKFPHAGKYDWDEERLVYASTAGDESLIQVDELDWKTGRSSHYVVEIGGNNRLSASILDLRLLDHRVHLLVLSDERGDTVNSRMKDYTFDLQSGRLLETQALDFGITPPAASMITYRLYGQYGSPYLIIGLGISTQDERLEEGAGQRSRGHREFFLFRYADGALTSLTETIEKFGNPDTVDLYLENEILTIVHEDGETDTYGWPASYPVNRFDLSAGETLPGYTISASAFGVDRLGYLVYHDGTFRFVMQKGDRPMAAVIDAATGQPLATVKAVYAGDASREPDLLKDLRLLNLELRHSE